MLFCNLQCDEMFFYLNLIFKDSAQIFLYNNFETDRFCFHLLIKRYSISKRAAMQTIIFEDGEWSSQTSSWYIVQLLILTANYMLQTTCYIWIKNKMFEFFFCTIYYTRSYWIWDIGTRKVDQKWHVGGVWSHRGYVEPYLIIIT